MPDPLEEAVELALVPRPGTPLPLPAFAPPLAVVEVLDDRTKAGGAIEYLFDGFVLAGGFSTNEVSVVLHSVSTPVSIHVSPQSRSINQHSQECSINILPPTTHTRLPPVLRPSTRILPHRLLMPRSLPRPPEALRARRLGEIDTKRTHVETVEEAGKVLVEARDGLVQDLQVHHVGLEVGHAVAELGKGGLEALEREGGG